MKLKVRLLISGLMIAVAALVHFSRQPSLHGSMPVSLQKDLLRLGQLQFQPCDIGKQNQRGTLAAYCTQFSVPENRAISGGRQIQLKVALLTSEAAKPDSDLVVFLDGGPGGAATNDYPAISDAFAPLRRRHHILLVDQRGTGGSNSLDCPQVEANTKNLMDQLSRKTLEPARVKELIQQCVVELRDKADPRFYSTTDATADLEAIRMALELPQSDSQSEVHQHVTFDLIGVSYGTRMAQQYAMRYPTAVRSIVLDSAVPNTVVLGADNARVLEDALKIQMAACTQSPACQQHFGDAYANLHTLHQQLRAQPVHIEMRDPNTFVIAQRSLTADGFATLVRLYAYNSVTSALLPLMTHEALHENYAPLLGQVQLVMDGATEMLNTGMSLSVVCAEDADLLRINVADADTLLGNSLIEFYQQACPVWPHGTRPADFHQPFKSTIPLLVLSGENDPVTPTRYGEAIVQELPNARLLTLHGQGHAVLVTRCMPELLEKFVVTLNPQQLDTSCLNSLQPIPMFIDYNGAAP